MQLRQSMCIDRWIKERYANYERTGVIRTGVIPISAINGKYKEIILI